jgi:hypothetical protein
MIDVVLATQIAQILAPFLPMLLDAAAGSNVKQSDITFAKANSLLKKIKKDLSPEIANTFDEVAKKPNDQRAEAVLSWQLEKLTLTPKTREEIQKIKLLAISCGCDRSNNSSGIQIQPPGLSS